MTKLVMLGSTIGMLLFAVPEPGDTRVELKQVHMCCAGCAEEVVNVLKKVDGVREATSEQKTRTAKFAAVNIKTAQRALDALADAGFYGETGTKDYAFRNDSEVKAGKVKSLTVYGFHNSCPGCVNAFHEAIKMVPGVTGDDAKSKITNCVVTGNFEATSLVEALNKGGFHVKVRP